FVFLLLGFVNARETTRYFQWLAAAAILFQVLLCWGAFHDLCARIWSGFDTLDPTRTIMLFVVAASVLAAAGLDRLTALNSRRLLRSLVCAIVLLSLTVGALWLAPRVMDIPTMIRNAGVSNETYSAAFFQDAGQQILQGFGDSAAILMLPIGI